MENLILSLPHTRKIKMLEDALKEDKFSIFMDLAKVLMEKSEEEGGVDSEVVQKIFKKYNRK